MERSYLDQMWESLGPLFEEREVPDEDEAEEAPSTEERIAAVEHRLEQTLKAVNRCQQTMYDLQKKLGKLAAEQDSARKARAHRRNAARRCLGWAALLTLAVLLGGACWQLTTALASLLELPPGRVAGTVTAASLLTLLAVLGRKLPRLLFTETEL